MLGSWTHIISMYIMSSNKVCCYNAIYDCIESILQADYFLIGKNVLLIPLVSYLTHFSLFLHLIETSHLICTADQMTGFCEM